MKRFWLGQDNKSGEALELGALSQDVLMKDMGQWLKSGVALLLTQEGPSLLPFGEMKLELEDAGAALAQEDSAIVE